MHLMKEIGILKYYPLGGHKSYVIYIYIFSIQIFIAISLDRFYLFEFRKIKKNHQFYLWHGYHCMWYFKCLFGAITTRINEIPAFTDVFYVIYNFFSLKCINVIIL